MVNNSLKPFFPLVDAIAQTFGSNCEVVLHDFSKPHESIVKIVNKHVTGRDVGSPATDLILSLLENNGPPNDMLVGYKTINQKGSTLRSTSIFIRNDKNEIIGALCINIDLSSFESMRMWLRQMCQLSEDGEADSAPMEEFDASVDNIVNRLIDQNIMSIAKPVAQMTKEDKLRVIKGLKERGFFRIKGSNKRVSERLNVSLPTVYKYLEEVEPTNT